MDKFLKRNSRMIAVLAILIGLIIIYVILNIFLEGRFLTYKNFSLIFTHAVIPCFLAWGMSVGFTLGMMDFSVGAIIVLAANAAGYGGLALGYPGLFLAAIAIAALLIFANYNVFVRTAVPSWVAGLGLALFYEAIGYLYTTLRLKQGNQVIDLGTVCRGLLSPPFNYLMVAIGLVLAYLLFNRMSIGLNIRATGSNSTIAKMMGINTKRTVLIGALVAGLFIGMASALNESYSGRVQPMTGLGTIAQLFQPMAAFLLAISIRRIISPTFGIVLSAFFVASIFTALTMFGVPSGTFQEVALGLIVILCGIMAQRNFKGVVK